MTKSYGKGARLAALGLATAAVLSLAAPAFAATAKPAQTAKPGAAETAQGKLRQPTAAEKKALADGVRAMFQQIPAKSLPTKQFGDGTTSINFGTAYLNISIAQVGPDGAIHEICIDNPADADASSMPLRPMRTNKP